MSATLAAGPRVLVMTTAIGFAGLAAIGTGVPLMREVTAMPVGTAIRFAEPMGPMVLVSAPITGATAADVTEMIGVNSSFSADLVVELKRLTGFTWDQLSKALGVSRRTTHLWAAGGKMAASNEEAALRLVHEVRSIDSTDEGERRLSLLELLDRERAARASSDTDINRPAPLYPTYPNVLV